MVARHREICREYPLWKLDLLIHFVFVSERRNAMGDPMHRKSLLKGILSVTTRGQQIPDAQLKEGKKIPIYMATEGYSVPENCHKPLEDLDSYYNGETYIVLNKQGTIFRFNKAKSMFLFDCESKLRRTAVRLFTAPLFAHFITLVILCNCACMVLVDPPTWIEDYLEYVFTAIYIVEAAIKIVARGFVLHRFSYLRDPWNWLDFIVIMTAIITEVLKAAFSEGMFSKVAVLRAFRVLRALKTMSIVPGLRAIVKALLRSIRALKDAVLLTIFCVSVFGLVGYQLFHGTMRHKCIRIAGTLDIPPDSLYLNVSAFTNFSNLNELAQCKTAASNRDSLLLNLAFASTGQCCTLQKKKSCLVKRQWSRAEKSILNATINYTKKLFQPYSNESDSAINRTRDQCSREGLLNITTNSSLQYLANITYFDVDTSEQLDFDPGDSVSNFTHFQANASSWNLTTEVKISVVAADVHCLRRIGNDSNELWRELLDFEDKHLDRWNDTRQYIIKFQVRVPRFNGSYLSFPFLYYSEMDEKDLEEKNLLTAWMEDEENQCKVEPKTVVFFHPGSPDRPIPEPMYCSMSGSDKCPTGYKCLEAGANPDYGYTGFDHFFLAFLTSFRLVSLDAWSRLYYLTLHTAGPTYAIFYILVVFLGSYYLVNLILAVVYMAYEEQQAVVDEEECAAKEREEEEREMQEANGSFCANCISSGSSNLSSDVESDVRMGLITTSLGPNVNPVSRGSFYLRHRRRRLRHQSHPNVRSMQAEMLPLDGDGQEENYSYRRLCRVMSDSLEHIGERNCKENLAGSRLRLHPLDGDVRQRRLSTPAIKLEMAESLSKTTPKRKPEQPRGKRSTPSNDATRQFHFENEIKTNNQDTLFPFILPPRRLSELSSDESESSHQDKEVKIEVEPDPDVGRYRTKTPVITVNQYRQQSLPADPGKNKYLAPPADLHFLKQARQEDIDRVDFVKPSDRNHSHDQKKAYNGATKHYGDDMRDPSEEAELIKARTRQHQNKETCNRKRKRRTKKRMSPEGMYQCFIDNFAKWKCLPSNLQPLQAKIRDLVLNPFTDLIITICIALNGLFLAVEHYPIDEAFNLKLEQANMFFTTVFTVEMLAKIVGLSPYTYFRQRWNVFDAIVVLFSLLEYFVKTTGGFSILRAFRLMRIIKLAKQWPILNKLLRIIGRTLGKLSHLTLVFLIVLYIFAVVGMQLLHKSYEDRFQKNLPRWNFVDFPHAFMVVFRVQCGEWVENMFVCLNVASPGVCIPLFVTVYVIGNLVILNLFLALLLNSFSGDVLQHTTSENNSLSEAMKRVKKWVRKQRKKMRAIPSTNICQLLKLRFKRHPKDYQQTPVPPGAPADTPETEMTLLSIDKTDDVISSNGHTNNHDFTCSIAPELDENSPIFEKKDTEYYLAVHPARHHSPQSLYRFGSERASRTWSINSNASAWSYRSAPARRVRRSHRGLIVRSKTLARDRYRGLCSSLEVHKEQHNRDTEMQMSDPASEHEEEHKLSEDETKKDMKEPVQKKEKQMEPCLPCISDCCFDRGAFLSLRKFAFKVVTHRHFENLVIFLILISSIALALEDIHLHKKPVLQKVLKYIEVFCCVFFTFEMLIKWVGLGWKKYFTNYWCLLDCAIVLISIINLSVATSVQSNWSAFRALRTFRALRPLRALSRFKGMKVVVDALIRAIPPILNVFLVCLVFWLIFGILGVNMFGGRFGRCVALPTKDILPYRVEPNDTEGFRSSLRPPNMTLAEQCSSNNTLLMKYLQGELTSQNINPLDVLPAVRNKHECEECAILLNSSVIEWNIPSVNFDSVPKAYLALLQLATFNGWMEIMASAVDATGIDEQPSHEASFYNYLYFCVFIIFGAFFSLNLFIGVIIDNFNQQKIKQKGGEDGVFLTDEQRQYYNAMKKMASKTPKKPIPRPVNRFANKIYDIVTDRRFEIGVMIFIMLNLVVMAIEYHGMPEELKYHLQKLNQAFIGIFVVEAILKLIGLRQYYFTVAWNVFDCLVVIVSIIAMGLNDVMSQFFVQPTLFRIIRLFRVTRILRLIREAKGIRTLLFALMMSLPALFNIGSLLFLLMSIYAIIGMSQFPYIQKISGIDDILNFETFPNAFLTLFQMSTSEGWDKFIDPVLLDQSPYCDPHPADGPSNCGNTAVGAFFFVTYVIISFLIVVNMYIAVILENFEVATRENAEPLTADDFEQFFEVWQKYDDRLTQYVHYEQLKRLLNELDVPLRIPIPNTAFIAISKMRFTQDGRIHCLEVVIALIKNVLGDSPELNSLKETMMESFMLKCKTKDDVEESQDTIDSEKFTILYRSVIILQRAYRHYRKQKEINKTIAEMIKELNSDEEVPDIRKSKTRRPSYDPPG